MSRLWSIGASTLISGGVMGSGSVGGYIGDASRRALQFADGVVYLCSYCDLLNFSCVF